MDSSQADANQMVRFQEKFAEHNKQVRALLKSLTERLKGHFDELQSNVCKKKVSNDTREQLCF